MRTTTLVMAAGALILSPATTFAKPGGGQGGGSRVGMGHGAMSQTTTTNMGQGSTRGVGWDHMNGPTKTRQPGVECEDVRPGKSATAPGSAFNEDGKAGTRYAGEQPQNSRNSASVSQYDVACLNQPQR